MIGATNPRTARGNRLGLVVVGVLLLAAGLAALARGLDVAPQLLGGAGQPVLDERVRDTAAQPWFWPVVAVGLLLVALLALRWLAVQTRSGAIRSIRLEPDPSHGRTTLPAKVVTAALADDLATQLRPRRTQVALTGHRMRPQLQLELTLPVDADPVAVQYGLRRALARHRRALEAGDLPANVLLRAT